MIGEIRTVSQRHKKEDHCFPRPGAGDFFAQKCGHSGPVYQPNTYGGFPLNMLTTCYTPRMQDIVVRWARAFNSGNPNKVLDLYAHDSVLLPTLCPELLSKKAMKGYFHDLLVNKGAKVKVGKYVKVMGVESGFYVFNLADGNTVVARFTFAPQGRLISTHHSSEIPRQ